MRQLFALLAVLEPGGESPEEFAAFIQADRERWKNRILDAKIEPN